MAGQILIGLSQPFVLSAPPYYSNTWFTSSGRTSATAVASLSNPIGAALAQLLNPLMCTAPEHIPNMTLYISIISSVACLSFLVLPAAPPTPPSAAAAVEKIHVLESLRALKHNTAFHALAVMFSVYLGAFNAFSTLLAQILRPEEGYTADEAGLTGAVLIVVGLVAAAVMSPLIDRTQAFVPCLRLLVPIIAVCYVLFIFMPAWSSGGLVGVMVLAGVLGGASFALLPVALEFAVEVTYPAGIEVVSSILWCGGQVVGAGLIVGMDAMRGGNGGSMKGACGVVAGLEIGRAHV